MSAFGTLVATEQRFLESPLRVRRVGFVMSAVCPVYPQQQTSPDPVGTSHLGQEPTSRRTSRPEERGCGGAGGNQEICPRWKPRVPSIAVVRGGHQPPFW